MDCLKNKKPCFIEYAQENGESVFYTNSHIRKVCGGNITIECDQGQFILLADRVLRSAYSKEELP
ncbi:MAG: hypothetical protein LBB60_04360 [Desulfovibrio sp.]|jgi:hypothetical protein|nr:hypothetical protein [Desulfovibrio sp.]